MVHIGNKELWLEVKDLLHQVNEGKKTVDDLISISLQRLEEIEESETHLKALDVLFHPGEHP